MLQKAIKKAHMDIEKLQATIELAKLLPESDLPTRINITTDTIHVNLPFDWSVYRKYRQLLGKEWESDIEWVTTQHERDNSISHHKSFQRKGQKGTWPNLMIALDSSSDKSVCQVKQVGVKEVPIMEVVCN